MTHRKIIKMYYLKKSTQSVTSADYKLSDYKLRVLS